jgi:hypothetical protein
MPRPFDSSKAPTSSSASPNAIRFVSFRSSVCAYASLALRALRFEVVASEIVFGSRPGEGEMFHAPSATAALLGAVVRYGQRLHNLGRWGRSQPIKVLLDLLSELVSITTYTKRESASRHGSHGVEEGQTVSSIPFQIHSGSQNAFGTNRSLQLKLMLRRCALNEFGLVHEASMSLLSRAREPSCNFPLCTKKLDDRYSKTGGCKGRCSELT